MNYPFQPLRLPSLLIRLWLALSLVVIPMGSTMSGLGQACVHMEVSSTESVETACLYTQNLGHHAPSPEAAHAQCGSDHVPTGSCDHGVCGACGVCGGQGVVANRSGVFMTHAGTFRSGFSIAMAMQTFLQPDLRPPRFLI